VAYFLVIMSLRTRHIFGRNEVSLVDDWIYANCQVLWDRFPFHGEDGGSAHVFEHCGAEFFAWVFRFSLQSCASRASLSADKCSAFYESPGG